MLTASVSLLHFGVRGARDLRKRHPRPQLNVERYVNLTYKASTLPDGPADVNFKVERRWNQGYEWDGAG
jgi:hypothetical protein